MMRIAPAAPSVPTRVEGAQGRVEGPARDTLVDTLTEPGSRSRTIFKRKRITPLAGFGFALGFLGGMLVVAAVAHYWLRITLF